jgi:hypothetical protein
MVVSLLEPPCPVRSGALFELLDIRTTSRKVLIIVRKINLVAIHPTVKTVGFLAESCKPVIVG